MADGTMDLTGLTGQERRDAERRKKKAEADAKAAAAAPLAGELGPITADEWSARPVPQGRMQPLLPELTLDARGQLTPESRAAARALAPAMLAAADAQRMAPRGPAVAATAAQDLGLGTFSVTPAVRVAAAPQTPQIQIGTGYTRDLLDMGKALMADQPSGSQDIVDFLVSAGRQKAGRRMVEQAAALGQQAASQQAQSNLAAMSGALDRQARADESSAQLAAAAAREEAQQSGLFERTALQQQAETVRSREKLAQDMQLKAPEMQKTALEARQLAAQQQLAAELIKDPTNPVISSLYSALRTGSMPQEKVITGGLDGDLYAVYDPISGSFTRGGKLSEAVADQEIAKRLQGGAEAVAGKKDGVPGIWRMVNGVPVFTPQQ